MTSTSGRILLISFSYARDLMVPAVPITPTRFVFVAAAAALALSVTLRLSSVARTASATDQVVINCSNDTELRNDLAAKADPKTLLTSALPRRLRNAAR